MYTEKEASKTVDQTGLLGRPEVYRCLRPTPLVNVYTTSFSCYFVNINEQTRARESRALVAPAASTGYLCLPDVGQLETK